jgi:hypothetical protein
MFENLWIKGLHPDLKEIVLNAIERGIPVSYNPFARLVTIDYGPLAMRGYDAKTGELRMLS